MKLSNQSHVFATCRCGEQRTSRFEAKAILSLSVGYTMYNIQCMNSMEYMLDISIIPEISKLYYRHLYWGRIVEQNCGTEFFDSNRTQWVDIPPPGSGGLKQQCQATVLLLEKLMDYRYIVPVPSGLLEWLTRVIYYWWLTTSDILVTYYRWVATSGLLLIGLTNRL